MINKYFCKNAKKDGNNTIVCQYCKEKYCKYQSYCPADHQWYNSELYKQCEFLKEE